MSMNDSSRSLNCIRGKKNLVRYGTSEISSSSVIRLKQPRRGKRAVLCCIRYKKQKSELKGASHDLKSMRDLLIHHFGYLPDNMLILAEKESYIPPTRKNIEEAFQWLVRDIQPGDSLVFYFSGHGSRQQGIHGDELDGYDESICPVDFQVNGMIFDNYINEKIVKPLIPGVTLHALIDCCHSGTVLDLPHVYNTNTGKWEDNMPPSGNSDSKDTSGGRAICISACEDHQVAADASDFTQNENDKKGAMTSSFIKAVKDASANNQRITYHRLLCRMRESLRHEDKVGCVRKGLRSVLQRRILQDPLLSSSEVFDAKTELKL